MSKSENYCWNCAKMIDEGTGKRKRHYCNDACRMAYKRKSEQTKTEQIKSEHGLADIPDTIVDACGTAHKIDYDKRRKDQDLLDSWANGEGSPFQQRLGTLDRQNDVCQGYRFPKDGGLTDKGRRYLGLAEVVA